MGGPHETADNHVQKICRFALVPLLTPGTRITTCLALA
jgi:hypothetical protein